MSVAVDCKLIGTAKLPLASDNLPLVFTVIVPDPRPEALFRITVPFWMRLVPVRDAGAV